MPLYYFIINILICSRSGTQKTGAASFLYCRDIDVTVGALNISLYFAGAVSIFTASFKSSSSFNCWIMLPRWK